MRTLKAALVVQMCIYMIITNTKLKAALVVQICYSITTHEKIESSISCTNMLRDHNS
jgi:hypothetical protein